MEMAREQLHDIEMEIWAKKADKHLQAFYDSYYSVVSGDCHNFRDVELLMKEKAKCIREWQNYYAIDLEPYRTTIYPKRYMKEYLGNDYDPCMDSRYGLEKKLDACVASMRPEQKRKNRLYDVIVDYVTEKETVPRSELLKTAFDGFIAEEIKCCYKELVSKNRLVETKTGNRWFVSLSDKELFKKEKSKKTDYMTPEEFAAKCAGK